MEPASLGGGGKKVHCLVRRTLSSTRAPPSALPTQQSKMCSHAPTAAASAWRRSVCTSESQPGMLT
eukprot:scaffold21787_cov62-Phaeocystis_antarctica.AAC.2